jgi:hypothetical protein
MKKNITLTLAGLAAIGAMSFEILYGEGKAGKTGSPGESTCVSCHSGTPLNSGPGSVAISSIPSLANGYIANNTYAVSVTITESAAPNNALFGFGFESLFPSGADAGLLAITNSTLTTIQTATIGSNVRTNVVQNGLGNVGPNTQIFTFNWTAPPKSSGTVTFYTTGLAADNDASTSGDHVYSDSLTLVEDLYGSITEKQYPEISLSVYPNPASNYINTKLTVTQACAVSVNLLDINGNIVSKLVSERKIQGETERSFDVTPYSRGIYFLQIKGDKSLSLEKIILE